jgi:hypothetical protein
MAAAGKIAPVNVADPDGFTPELEVLLQVALDAISGEISTVVSARKIHWNELLHLAELHGLEPFLLKKLRKSAAGVPSYALATLEENCSEIAGRNLVLGRELIAVSAYLRHHGIDHLAYKGPLLGQTLYGSLAMRPSRDLDLLVRPSQAEQAFTALKEIGYSDKDNLNRRQQRASIRFATEQCFAKDRIEIDLHWNPVPRHVSRSRDMEGIWERISFAPLFDAELPTLRAEDLFVALCLHAGEHAWSQLSHFSDLGRLLKLNPGFDWQLVRHQMQDENTRRTLDVTLLLLANYFGVAIPPDMLRREMQVELIAAHVATEFWPIPERAPHKETSLAWIMQRCKGERLRNRIRWVSGSILTPTLADFQSLSLPESLQFLYPVVRLLRLTFRRSRTSILPELPS